MPEPRLPVSDREPRPDTAFWTDRTSHNGLRRPGRVERPIDRIRDRVHLLRGDPRAGIALLVVVAVVAGVVWYRAGAGNSGAVPPRSSASTPAPASTVATAASVDEPNTEPGGNAQEGGTGRRLVVHVAGAVTEPGVVDLPAGARVVDALEAAGGGVAEADLDRLNLAAKVVDGQRILVQKVGDPPAPLDASTPTADPPGTTSGPLDLNAATAAQLDDALPGIGPTLADAIVSERDRRGGFRSVNELRDVRGIGEKRFADIEDKVTV